MTDHSRASGAPQRRPWTPPAILRTRSGEAQAGANPANPEGAFANGS